MRTIAKRLIGCLVGLPVGALAQEPACHVEAETSSSMNVSCAIAPDVSQRRFEFVARFAGGHDDTRASIETVLDGEASACDEGSKKTLFGEDGNVSLHCRFTVLAKPANASRFTVTVRWSHAQFESFELIRRGS